MMQPISFFVEGLPKPAGSKRAFVVKGRAIITDANPKSKDWKMDVKHAARSVVDRMEGNVLRCPLKLRVVFNMPRPKSHYNSKGQLKPTAPHFHTNKPDATKLLRGTEDALTGLLWNDDSQICVQHVRKVYSETPGAAIEVSEADEYP